MALPVKLDHCVIHVSDWERSNAFYSAVMGAELVKRPNGWAYRFGGVQLNLHAWKPAAKTRAAGKHTPSKASKAARHRPPNPRTP